MGDDGNAVIWGGERPDFVLGYCTAMVIPAWLV